MFPMDFEEYLWALGDRVTIPVIEEAFRRCGSQKNYEELQILYGC